MPRLTKTYVSDQVLYRLYGGIYDVSSPVQPEDVWKALEQKVNSLFKLRYIDTTLPSGETIPDGAMIATYEGVTVTGLDNGTSKALLPVIPISMLKNMGIYLVYHADYPDFPFIPIQRGQRALMRTDEILNDFFGQISYEPKNNYILFSKDITLFGLTAVTIELCVLDMSLYSEMDVLPIPSDYESQIVNELVAEFAPIVPENGMVNTWSNANQKGGKQ